MMGDPQSKSTPRRGSTGLLVVLAALPFVAKWATLGASGYAAQSLYKLLQLAAPVGWRWKVDGKRGLAAWWPVDEPLPSARTWGVAVGVAALLAGSAIVAVPLLAARLDVDPRQLRTALDARFALTPWRAAGIVLYLLTINAALEELHFRAWLDREFSARWGNAAGIGLSAFLFAAMHVFIFVGMPGAGPPELALLFVALAIAAVAWSLIARRPGGIHAAWLSHGLTDAGLLTWGLFWLGYFSS